MKAGTLRSAIRLSKGAIYCDVLLPNGQTRLCVAVAKVDLISKLKTTFPLSSTETGMLFVDNRLTFDVRPEPEPEARSAPEPHPAPKATAVDTYADLFA